jgi:hypothetical protein
MLYKTIVGTNTRSLINICSQKYEFVKQKNWGEVLPRDIAYWCEENCGKYKSNQNSEINMN